MKEKGGQQLQTLQILRFIAALLVVLYHHTLHYNHADISFLKNIFYFGYSGVDIFFVLSGFIIFYVKSQKQYSATSFLTRRLIRIYPPYWVLLLIPTLLSLVFNISNAYDIEVFNFQNSIKTILLTHDHIKIGPSWTLSYEVYFYLFITLSFIAKKNFEILYFLFLVPLINLVFAPSFMNDWTFFANPIILEFLIGIVVFKIYSQNILSKKASIILLSVSITFFSFNGVILEYLYNYSLSRHFRVLFFGLPAGGIILSLVTIESKVRIKVPSKIVLLGSASYSLYLIHTYLISPIDSFALKLPHEITPLISLSGTVLVTFISLYTYKYIEQPMTSNLNRLNKKYLSSRWQ